MNSSASRAPQRTENEGYLNDPALLDRLVKERCEKLVEDLLAQGWALGEALARCLLIEDIALKARKKYQVQRGSGGSEIQRQRH